MGADRFADFFEGIAAAAVDAEKVADAIVGHVSHLGQAAVDTAIVPVINEAVCDRHVVTEAVSDLQAVFSGPGTGRNFHAVDISRGNDLLSPDCAAASIALNVGGH